MRTQFVIGSLLALLGAAAASAQTPLSTGFTYQGQLKEDDMPLTGTADFQFTLWDAAGTGSPPAGGAQLGSLEQVNALPVNGGLFTVILNANGTFGASAFDGSSRWLQIAVRSPAGGGAFTTLAPRQSITAAPYALKVPGVDGHSLDAADGSPMDALAVDNAGKVGIGTSTPTELLTLQTSANSYGLLHTDGVRSLATYIGGGGNGGYIGTTSTHSLHLYADDSDPLLTVHPNRNVGIGTLAPASKLDISASGDGAELLRFSTERPWVFRQVRTGPSAGLQLLSTTGQKKLEVTANDGNNVATFLADSVNSKVGIGTTDPAAKLQVVGGAEATTSGGGEIVAGSTTGANIAIDGSQIMARFNGGPFGLVINNHGADVVFGGAIDIGYEIVVAVEAFDFVSCPAGKKVLGGGCRIEGDAEIRKSYPLNNGWQCERGDLSGLPHITAYAICARVK